MEEGMIFTIEPMFCQGTAVGVQWPDKWTVTTADGGRSAQFEHTVIIKLSKRQQVRESQRAFISHLLEPFRS